ncbi:MAG: 3'(2'),5'-bisphosphate nucleotidase CysQ [Erysipelotrichaceae bacterium]|jgi:3'(2'), 5'-bisphosphate nucleotidase|nr:3'(2'),5'-bisphosphate nucleotidase CysQ [Erysipelotrichaceae bacterium]
MMWEEQLNAAIEAGIQAIDGILEVYNSQFDVEIKEDDSPVTLADKNADRIIREYLHNKFPTYAFLTEESVDDKSRLNNDYVWIVDPVDGTKDFVARDGGFCTNIALAYKHEVVVGVVVVPLTGEVYYAAKGMGAFYRHNGTTKRIHVNDKTEDLIVLRSVFHSNAKEDAVIAKYSGKIAKQEKWGSALKPCRIAHGLAELSYRLSAGTKEWDTAACQIIVEEAGGIFLDTNGKRITYNREDVYNRDGYIICNRIENFLL